MNDRIAEHREAVAAIALRLSRGAVALQVGAEYDDLEQWGLIQVWQNLERGVDPMHYVEYRMKDYTRWLGVQVGRGRGDTSETYDALLPLDDFRGVLAAD